jgi:hypothetical protein
MLLGLGAACSAAAHLRVREDRLARVPQSSAELVRFVDSVSLSPDSTDVRWRRFRHRRVCVSMLLTSQKLREARLSKLLDDWLSGFLAPGAFKELLERPPRVSKVLAARLLACGRSLRTLSGKRQGAAIHSVRVEHPRHPCRVLHVDRGNFFCALGCPHRCTESLAIVLAVENRCSAT